MPFVLKLFHIQLYNSYYKTGLSNDFELTPDPVTQSWMRRYGMRLISGDGYFEFIWLVANLDNPLAVFQEKMAQRKLTFQLELKNPQIINFSALSIGEGSGSIYHLHNLNTAPRLHKENYISDVDLVPSQQLMEKTNQPGKNILGKVEIYLDQLDQQKEHGIDAWPVNYSIHIKAIESIWRYHIVDTNKRIKVPIKVVLDEDNSYFINKETPERDDVYVYESKEPLALLDKPGYFFSLKAYPTKKTNISGITLVAKLPIPGVGTLLAKKEGGKEVFYSDMMVYV